MGETSVYRGCTCGSFAPFSLGTSPGTGLTLALQPEPRAGGSYRQAHPGRMRSAAHAASGRQAARVRGVVFLRDRRGRSPRQRQRRLPLWEPGWAGGAEHRGHLAKWAWLRVFLQFHYLLRARREHVCALGRCLSGRQKESLVTARCQSSFGGRRDHAVVGWAPGRAAEGATSVCSGIRRGRGLLPRAVGASLGQENVVLLLSHVK